MATRYELPVGFDRRQLVQQAAAWQQLLGQLIPQGQIQQQVLFTHWVDGRRVALKIDWVLQSPDGNAVALFMESTYYGQSPQKKAKEVVAQLAAAAEIWKLKLGLQMVVQCYIHFPALGVLLQVANV
jgi:hypothetical protein